MDLYLVRHAIAYERDGRKWPDDSQRPLTPQGKTRFSQAARGLRHLVDRVDLVLSSPFVRAWQTAELLEEVGHWPSPTRFELLEPGNSPGEIVKALRSYKDTRAIALVGHEPDLGEFASFLLTGKDNNLSLDIKKGSVINLQFDLALQPGSATLCWMAAPRLLRSLQH